MPENNGSGLRLKMGLAEMLKGGVIMDVMSAEQAEVAEKAGAVAVMALERVPAMIRAEGGVARMANPKRIKEIMAVVSIPVMAKCRIGHFAEAQILQELGVDYIDESEVLTPADEAHHVDKHAFTVPFVCGARNLGEALRRIAEGAAMIRTKGEAGTGDVVHAVKHMRQIVKEMRQLTVYERTRAVCGGQEPPGSLRAGPHGSQGRQTARAEFFRGRHCHPGRRCADDATWRRGDLCRLRHLHEGWHDAARYAATPRNAPKPRAAPGPSYCYHPLQRSQSAGRSQRTGHRRHEGTGGWLHRRKRYAAKTRVVRHIQKAISERRACRAGASTVVVFRVESSGKVTN